MEATPAVLAVCTGNICRSPAVELLLSRALEPLGANEPLVASAGTHAVVGAGVDPNVAALLGAEGVPFDAFRARQLTPAILREPRLVLTLTRAHRSLVVQTLPAVLRRTFTVRELARLVAGIPDAELEAVRAHANPVARIEALVAAAQRARAALAGSLTHEDLDIEDPYRRSEDVHARVYGQITDEVGVIARALTGEVPRVEVKP